MISTELSKEEAKEESLCCGPGDGEGPRYSYGTRVVLDDLLLERLGMTGVPEVGTKYLLTAEVEVVGSSISQHHDHTDRSADLQITGMELAMAGKKDLAKILYEK